MTETPAPQAKRLEPDDHRELAQYVVEELSKIRNKEQRIRFVTSALGGVELGTIQKVEAAAAAREGQVRVARSLLRGLWQLFDLEGISHGRSEECRLLEAANGLIGPGEPSENEEYDRNPGAYLLKGERMYRDKLAALNPTGDSDGK